MIQCICEPGLALPHLYRYTWHGLVLSRWFKAEGKLRGNSTDTRPAGQITGGKGRKLRFLIPLALVLAAALVACSSSSSAREPAPDFPITIFQGEEVVGGQEINLRDLVGERPIVLNFWAGLCPPCRAEMPGFQAVYEEFKGDFILLGLDVGPFMNLGSNRDARNLLQELGISYPTARAHDRSGISEYGVASMPTTVFLTPDQEVLTTRRGFVDREQLAGPVRRLIDASAAIQ